MTEPIVIQPTRRERVNARKRRWYQANRERLRAKANEWRREHPEKYRQWFQNWKANNPVKYRTSLIARKFNVSIKEANRLAKITTCQICRRKNLKGRELHTDHNHKTSLVRGILCEHCNRALGMLKDDPILFVRAARYLRRSR